MPDASRKEMGETVVPDRKTPADTAPNTGPTARTGDAGSDASKDAAPKKKVVELGDFRLEKKLGQGGMGEVFLATQKSLDRKVALKVLSKELAKKPGFVERFVREARSMARIDHPNAVKVYAADSDKGLHYAAIEFIDGCSMQDVIDKHTRLSVGDAVSVILSCADALAHAHEMHLIHRDIKPDNILVTKKGVVKVADFGLAKAVDDEDMSMTQSGTGLGTPLYMPPEQARDAKNVDLRTDIYALGCTFYYFLTGKLPFTGETVLKLIIAKETGKYEPLRKLNPEVPDRVELIVDKMIQKEAKHRYANCAEVIADLEKLGLESETLSFAEDTDSSGRVRTRSRVSTTGSATAPGVSVAQFRTSAEDAEAQKKSQVTDVVWYVRFKNAKGDDQVKEMTTRQIQQGILSEALDVKTQAQKKSSKGGFLPLGGYPEFQDLLKKRLAKVQETARADNMKDMYAKIEKEQRWYKRKRWLGRFVGDVAGGFGLIIYLAVVVAVIIAVVVGIKMLYPIVADYLNL